MQFIKLVTSNGETRWINLNQVARVTIAQNASADEPVATILFSDCNGESSLTIHGSDRVNMHAINCLVSRLDACSGLPTYSAMTPEASCF